MHWNPKTSQGEKQPCWEFHAPPSYCGSLGGHHCLIFNRILVMAPWRRSTWRNSTWSQRWKILTIRPNDSFLVWTLPSSSCIPSCSFCMGWPGWTSQEDASAWRPPTCGKRWQEFRVLKFTCWDEPGRWLQLTMCNCIPDMFINSVQKKSWKHWQQPIAESKLCGINFIVIFTDCRV